MIHNLWISLARTEFRCKFRWVFSHWIISTGYFPLTTICTPRISSMPNVMHHKRNVFRFLFEPSANQLHIQSAQMINLKRKRETLEHRRCIESGVLVLITIRLSDVSYDSPHLLGPVHRDTALTWVTQVEPHRGAPARLCDRAMSFDGVASSLCNLNHW